MPERGGSEGSPQKEGAVSAAMKGGGRGRGGRAGGGAAAAEEPAGSEAQR